MRMGGAPPGAGPQEEVGELGLPASSAPAPGCPGVQTRGYGMTVLPLPVPLRPGAAGLARGTEVPHSLDDGLRLLSSQRRWRPGLRAGALHTDH